jgi:hypothetical protein
MTTADRDSNAASTDRDARQDAAVVSEHLEAIRRVLRESIWAEARRYPIPLTPPQITALEALVDHTREAGTGLSRIELTGPVRDWLDRDLPAARLGPLVDALRNASDDERSAILDGPAALRRLLPGT